MSGCGCFGRLFNKRGKSLPPGGTRVGKTKSNEKKNSKKDSFHKSLPSLVNNNNRNNDEISSQMQSPRSEKTESGLKNIKMLLKETKNNKSSASKTEENIYDNDLIIPAPLNFREKAVSRESINSVGENDFDEESLSLSLSSEKENQNKEVDFLNQLNKDLNSQLKSQSYSNLDEPKSAASITSGNITLKSNPIKKEQNTPQLETNYATIGSIIKSTQKLFENSNEQKPNLTTTANFSGNNSTKKSNNIQASITFKDQDSSTSLANHTFQLDEIQKIVNGFNIDKDEIYNLKSENKSLSAKIEGLQNQLLERESKYKKENDILIERIHNILTKDTRSVNEVESIAKIFMPLQQQSNQTIINEQSKLIEDLKNKCNKYENELKKPNEIEIEKLKEQIESYKQEISILRKLVHKLNIELSKYQSKYPSDSVKNSLKNEKSELSGLPNNGPIPLWLVNVKYLSPLIASYDERINKKDEKLKLFKKKFDNLTSKFKLILDENNQLHTKLDKTKNILTVSQYNPDEKSSDNLEQIKHHALLVLEENKALKENNEFLKRQLLNYQKQHIAETGDLSKKIVINESEKSDLKNQIELLKSDYDSLLQKYNDTLAESQRRVKLQEHLAQTGHLKRKMDEINILHKHELEHSMSLVQTLESEKKELALKNVDLSNQNKKLFAENQVLDKALKEGIGRKIQRKIKELEKKVELAELKEKTAYICLEKLKKELEKTQIDKEAFENLTKSNQLEIKKTQNKLAEENLKTSKLESKIDYLKEKSAEKISNVLQRVKDKESEFNLIKLESDKRIADVLNLLQKKQDQIDEMIKEKRELEAEVETVWQTTTTENRRLKEAFLEMKYNKLQEPLITKSSYYKLLLEEE